MAITDIDWGTVTLTNGSTAVTGTGTSFIADDLRDGDTFVFVDGGDGFQQPIVASVQSNTALTLRNAWEGPTLTATAYTLRYQWDSSRVSAMSRRLIMLLDNGNLTAFSQLTGPGVAVFDGPHSMVIRPFTDFVNGVSFDVQVDTLADRAAYDGQTEGFIVLVSDMGDGRSAVFTKNSDTSADWSDAAYITGPSVSVTVGTTTEGPFGSSPDVTGVTGAGSLQLNFELPGSPSIDATVSSSPPGTTASVVTTPVTGGYELDFTLPEASGFNNAGVYDIAEAYSQDDVVRHNGSSFIALQTVPAGTSPSSAFPPGDTAFWQVLAAKGADGTGTGDFVGPNGGVADGDLVAFSGTTGKVGKKASGVTNDQLATMATARIKGRVATGTGAPQDLTAAQLWEILGETPNVNIPPRIGETATIVLTDANTPTASGWYQLAGSSSNAPETATLILLHISYSGTQARQFAYRHSNNNQWTRYKQGATWGDWFKVYSAADLIGTVSQSGGVPTGSVFQNGSNSNGSFVRYANGTQICISPPFELPSAEAVGSMFRSDTATWTYPAAFSAAPVVAASVTNTRWATVSNGLSSATLRSYSAVSVTADAAINAVAIGRWF